MRLWRTALAGLMLAAGALAQGTDAELGATYRKAMEAQRGGRLEEAVQLYAKVISLRPTLAEARVNLGLVYHLQRDYERAIPELEKAISLKPTLAGAHLFLGIARYSRNEVEPARKALGEAVKLSPNDPKARMWLGLACLEAGDLREAATQMDRAAELDPKSVDILYHRGRIHLRLSQESYRAMFAADPKSFRVHQVLAQSYEEAGRDEEAIAEYEAAIQLNPRLAGLNESVGNLYWRSGKLEQAEAALAREMELDPHSALAMYKLGAIRFRRGATQEGLPMLEQAVRLAPALLDARYYLGKAQAEVGRSEEAVANLRTVTEGETAGPLAESANYQLAQVYRKLNRPREAQLALERYRALKDEREQARADSLDRRKRELPQ